MSEVTINRKNTKFFINADPVSLALIPIEKEDDGGGGYRMKDLEPLPAQTFRLIPQSDVMPSVTTPDGVQLLPTYVLLGEHDAEMPRWAKFRINEVEFQITSPRRPDFREAEQAYEAKADVARL